MKIASSFSLVTIQLRLRIAHKGTLSPLKGILSPFNGLGFRVPVPLRASLQAVVGSFRKWGYLILGVLIIRILPVLLRVLYWDPLFLETPSW